MLCCRRFFNRGVCYTNSIWNSCAYETATDEYVEEKLSCHLKLLRTIVILINSNVWEPLSHEKNHPIRLNEYILFQTS